MDYPLNSGKLRRVLRTLHSSPDHREQLEKQRSRLPPDRVMFSRLAHPSAKISLRLITLNNLVPEPEKISVADRRDQFETGLRKEGNRTFLRFPSKKNKFLRSGTIKEIAVAATGNNLRSG